MYNAGMEPEIIDQVLDRLATGESLRAICRTPGYPSIWRFLRAVDDDESGQLAQQYARAREANGDTMDARVLEIADEVAASKMDPQAGRTAMEGYKWRAAHQRPHRYGDRVITAGDASAPVEHRLTVVYEERPAKLLDKGGESR